MRQFGRLVSEDGSQCFRDDPRGHGAATLSQGERLPREDGHRPQDGQLQR